jgi:hypothetical protein
VQRWSDRCSTRASVPAVSSKVELVLERVHAPRRPRLTHDAIAKEQPRLVLVMCVAPQLDVRDGRLAIRRVWLHVVELEKCGLATASLAAYECAAASVPPPDGTPYLRRDVARPSCIYRSRCECRTARTRRFGEAPAFQLLDEPRERAVEDLARIAGGKGVAQKRLRPAKPVVGLARDGELDPIAFGRERRDTRGCRRRC